MTDFSIKRLPVARNAIAPDGSDVRILLGLGGGGVAHFELTPGETSVAVAHRTVEEIWFFLSGRGEMWRKLNDHEEAVPVDPGVCLTIPVGTHFQFRSFGYEALAAIGVTMPPWPGKGEAYQVDGEWTSTVSPGAGGVGCTCRAGGLFRRSERDRATQETVNLIRGYREQPRTEAQTNFSPSLLP